MPAPAGGATTERPWPPGIKISVQISGDPPDDELQFVQQLGCTYVNIPGDAKSASAENYVRLKNKVESFGLRVWNIGLLKAFVQNKQQEQKSKINEDPLEPVHLFGIDPYHRAAHPVQP